VVLWLERAVYMRTALFSLLLYSSLSLYAQGEATTENSLKQAVQSDPGNGDTNYRLGEFYLHAGKLSEAVPYMEKSVALQPANYFAGYDLALAYFDLHDYNKAAQQIQSMLKIQNKAELHSLLADVEESRGDYLKAAAEYQTAAHLDPSEDRLFDWGTEFLIHQTYNPAITVLARGVDLYPQSLKLNVGLGIAFYLDQQYEKGLRQLCIATDLNPAEAWPYLFLGSSYAAMSSHYETDEVRKRLKRFASNQPQNARALYYYALSLWERNQISDAEAAEVQSLLKRAVALDPSFVDAHLQLGIFYSDRHSYPDAIHELLSALAIQPNLTTVHYHLAQAYTRTGQKELAKKELQAFERLHSAEAEESQAERNRIVQFVVNMRDQAGTAAPQ
jgi:tetratricopeptide (TPR) repeat protein